jgi:hypothetical protein
MNNNDETLLINILNTMYNDNLRQIHNLQDSNTQIRRLLTEFLSIRRPPRTNRSYRRPNINWNNVNWDYQQEQAQNSANLARESARQARETVNTIRDRNRIGATQTNTINQLLQHFFDPIQVFPTQTQIENATRIAFYRDIVNPNDQTLCPISLVRFNDEDRVSIIRYCGHIFHTEELLHWFRSSCICPVCRYDIRNYNINNDDSQNNIDHNNSNIINDNANIINETSEQINNTSPSQDISGNLLGVLTDAVFNNFLNTYTNNSNVNEPFFLDLIFDSSNNTIIYPNISQSRYYTFPYTRRD